MEEYKEDADETLSLSDLQMEEDTVGSEEVNQVFYQDFFGFSNEKWSIDTSSTNKPPVVSDVKVNKPAVNPMFRSSSGSFRYMRLKMASTTSTWRSKSVSALEKSRVVVSKSKSRWQVLLPGLGSGKFPKKMDLSDIKSRQLRRQMSTTDHHNSPASSVGHISRGEKGGLRSCKKGWWRLVDVLGCGGGYVRDTKVVVKGLH